MNKNKKNTIKFILVIVISALIGAGIGLASRKFEPQTLVFTEKIYRITFIASIVITMLVIIWVIGLIIYIKPRITEDIADNVPKSLDNKLNTAMIITSLSTVFTLTWLAIMIMKDEFVNKNTIYYIIVPAVILIIIFILQQITIKYFNKMYPNKKISSTDMNAGNTFFEKLDEGEKWVVYRAAYKVFMIMEGIFTITLAALVVFSIIFPVSILTLIVVALLWAIEKCIYFYEAKKYDVEAE